MMVTQTWQPLSVRAPGPPRLPVRCENCGIIAFHLLHDPSTGNVVQIGPSGTIFRFDHPVECWRCGGEITQDMVLASFNGDR
jgi:hypothetical protein